MPLVVVWLQSFSGVIHFSQDGVFRSESVFLDTPGVILTQKLSTFGQHYSPLTSRLP